MTGFELIQTNCHLGRTCRRTCAGMCIRPSMWRGVWSGHLLRTTCAPAPHPPGAVARPPRRSEECRLETDEFFLLLATGSRFVQIVLCRGAMCVPARGVGTQANREDQGRQPETRGANSRQAEWKSGLHNMRHHNVQILTFRREPRAVHRKPQGVAVGLVCRGLSDREPECMENGFDVRSIYTGVRMLQDSLQGVQESARKCNVPRSETGCPRRNTSPTEINGSEIRRACPSD